MSPMVSSHGIPPSVLAAGVLMTGPGPDLPDRLIVQGVRQVGDGGGSPPALVTAGDTGWEFGFCWLYCREWAYVMRIGPVTVEEMTAPLSACEPCIRRLSYLVLEHNWLGDVGGVDKPKELAPARSHRVPRGRHRRAALGRRTGWTSRVHQLVALLSRPVFRVRICGGHQPLAATVPGPSMPQPVQPSWDRPARPDCPGRDTVPTAATPAYEQPFPNTTDAEGHSRTPPNLVELAAVGIQHDQEQALL